MPEIINYQLFMINCSAERESGFTVKQLIIENLQLIIKTHFSIIDFLF